MAIGLEPPWPHLQPLTQCLASVVGLLGAPEAWGAGMVYMDF